MSGKIRLYGTTSGFGEITVPEEAGDQIFVVPSLGGELIVSGNSQDLNIGSLTTSGQVTFGGVGSIQLPSGSTFQRPAGPTAGMLRFNEDSDQFEGYDGTEWGAIAGSGGGGEGVTYSGASAWGNVATDGTLNNGLNIASVTRSATGTYDVVFTTPMPDANYSVVAASLSTSGKASWYNQSANGFTMLTVESGGPLTNYPFSFAVHSQNALPPAGTTGTDAWGMVQSDGTLAAGYNIASATRTATGTYSVVFTTPMPTNNYAVSATTSVDTGIAKRVLVITNKTVNGFDVYITGAGSGDAINSDFSCTVNATNANLPYTFTKEQIEAAISNTGSYAWATTAADGTLNGSNGLTCTKTGTGSYSYTFNTPLPDANYAVLCTGLNDGGSTAFSRVQNQTANGFDVITIVLSTGAVLNSPHSLTVTAAQGQPLSLGGGADAWGDVSETGTLNLGHNIASVTKVGVGIFDVVFTNPMPNDRYAVFGSSVEYNAYTFFFDSRTANGCRVRIWNGAGTVSQPADCNFSIAVFATDGNAGGFWGRTAIGELLPSNSTDTVKMGAIEASSLNGSAFAYRNILINGDLTINQRNADIASVATGEYGQDRWKKTAGGMTQIVEEGNYVVGATYTLSGTGITTQQLTAPASGNWTLPDIPVTARQIQLELGEVATAYERRPKGLELLLCQRYYYFRAEYQIASVVSNVYTGWRVLEGTFPVTMRANPSMNCTATFDGTGTFELISGSQSGYKAQSTQTSVNSYMTISDVSADAEL